MSRQTYIVIAEDCELDLVKRHREWDALPIIITGAGPVNVINALRVLPKDCHIINVGYAGSTSYVVGTEVRIGRVRSYHNIASINESEWTIDKGSQVLCLSSSDFLDCQKLRLTNAVYDMELVFILALGFEEVESYKVISDANNYCEYKQNTQV